ncbi:MAG: MdtA/MuxA family multidrug efflux RND transporter periplasmic adaptor subunit [Desulfovibrio sp.]|nr:MdtA/MuxA family multidrug efflux RND transporter periplasmic adaptor subunit [Desulfovibrio sp.]
MSSISRPARRGRWLILVLLALAVAVVSWRLTAFKGRPAGRGMALEAPPVRVALAQAQDVPHFLNGLGTVQPSSDVLVTSRVDGQLQRLHFKDGQRVRAGDLLAEIDPRPFQADLDQARGTLARDQAQLENARKDMARYATLSKNDFIARQEYDNQRALVRQYEGTVRADKAAVDAAALKLEYSRIVAPASGRLGLRTVDEGNMIRSSDSEGIVRITETRPCDVIFTLPDVHVPLIIAALRAAKDGAMPLVQAWDRDQRKLLDTGVLLSVDNRIDAATGTVRLKARLPNAGETLFPNQFVNARLLARVLHQAVTVPAAAVQTGVRGAYVYVLSKREDKDAVVLREVKTGIASDELTVIDEGLKAGELVVVDGLDRLRDGLSVTVAEQGQTPAAEAF